MDGGNGGMLKSSQGLGLAQEVFDVLLARETPSPKNLQGKRGTDSASSSSNPHPLAGGRYP